MSNSKTWQISRRHVLKGAGATMALPFLEAMVSPSRAVAAASDRMPVRFAGFFMPNGVNHAEFDPGKGRSLGTLPSSLEPLEDLKDYLTVITKLNNAESGHAAGTSSLFTGGPLKKTAKASEVRVSNPSIDQIIGRAFKESSILPTLELGMHTPLSGVSMSGHSKIYTSFVSWKSPTTPVPHEVNPHRAFDRLFKNARLTSSPGGVAPGALLTPDASVLDIVLEDARQLQKRLGRSDQQKLDEYLTAVREVEERLQYSAQAAQGLTITPQVLGEIRELRGRIKKSSDGKAGGSYQAVPKIPYPEYGRLMMDVMALAFWSNSTRASTLMFGHGTNGRNMSFLKGIDGSHHSISHHGYKQAGLKKFAIINRYFMGQYGYFLNRLKNMPEGNSNVLENSIVLLGSNISSGQTHNGKNIPVVVAGHGGGKIRGGRHLSADNQQIGSLHRSILDVMNLDGDQIKGGGRGTLKGF